MRSHERIEKRTDPSCRGFFQGSIYGSAKMHYYQFNIGDYQSHTSHLSETEDLIYRRLLDWYYLHEIPIPLDSEQTARQIRMRSHSDCIASVLQEYFEKTEDGWIHHRADKEIAKTGDKSVKASASAKARWDKVKDANALQTQSEGNATHNTLPNTQDTEHITQDTVIKEGKPSLSGTTFPPCPHTELLKLWGKNLPHLTQPRTWEGNRQANMRQRWIQAGKPSAYSLEGYKTTEDGLKWWDSFFGYIANDTSLAKGFEAKGRTWLPDLEWVVNATNFQKIIDGKYTK
jgi:uncharacterized protein YdaU (DUF1376 family)